MKNLKLILPIIFLALASLMISCGGGNTEKAQETKEVSKDGPEYTSAFICPMNCPGSGSDKMGVCPDCGMDYIANKNVKQDADNHDGHDHSGHDHSHEGHSH